MKLPFFQLSFSSRKMHCGTAICLACLMALSVGCPAEKQGGQAVAKDKILIKGSNTIGEELGPRLIKEYGKEHPAVAIEIETKGSASGVWSLIGGACDIAAASRSMIKDEEQQAQARGVQVNDDVIGAYSVAVVVNAANPVADLTREQVRDIFHGSIQNWKEVGGPDAPIHLCSRDPISGTYLGFRELALEDKPYSTNMSAFTNYEEIVQEVGKDANAIGYSSLHSANKSGAKPVAIGGVAAVAGAVTDGKYPFARKLHFFTNKSKESATARDFVTFVKSPKGQAILEEMGFVRAF